MKNRLLANSWMKSYFFILFSLPFYISAQDSVSVNTPFEITKKDTVTQKIPVTINGSFRELSKSQVKKRIRLIAAANIVGYGATMAGLYSDWYSNYPQTRFHFFNDNNEWKQIDKVGHAYSAYVESNGSIELWRWTGMNRNKRIWIGGL
ncbi:MAG: hypothetical protein JWQ09_4507, partial [Segetibacter sp.]|nr:hypothetical protein [Segetibacter sp.]